MYYTATGLFTFHIYNTATHWSQYLNVIPIYQYTCNRKGQNTEIVSRQNVQSIYKSWSEVQAVDTLDGDRFQDSHVRVT